MIGSSRSLVTAERGYTATRRALDAKHTAIMYTYVHVARRCRRTMEGGLAAPHAGEIRYTLFD